MKYKLDLDMEKITDFENLLRWQKESVLRSHFCITEMHVLIIIKPFHLQSFLLTFEEFLRSHAEVISKQMQSQNSIKY